MSIKSFIISVAFKIERKQQALFSVDVKKQRKFLMRFSEPKNDIERSFYQYKCQMHLYGMPIAFVLNAASFPLVICYLLSIKKTSNKKTKKKDSAVFLRDGKPQSILPQSLRGDFSELIIDPPEGSEISSEEISFIKELLHRYPLSWLFVLKILLKVARYRFLINNYSPKALIVCKEYSYTSSALTEYCHRQGLQFINVLHGEKLLYIRDSFFHFDKCYIWDDEYRDLFIKLRAEPTQFIVSVPDSICFSDSTGSVKKEIDYTYYLAAEDNTQLEIIRNTLKILKENGLRIAVRPHPRYSKMDNVIATLSEYEIEDYKTLTIEESVLRTKHAISLYSTVLNQAYHSNVKIIIDDISNPSHFQKLKELQYVMLSVGHELLSDVIKRIECGEEVEYDQ